MDPEQHAQTVEYLERIGAAVAVILAALTVGIALAGRASAATALTVDQPQYLPGQTVTFAGTGWDACRSTSPSTSSRAPISHSSTSSHQ